MPTQSKADPLSLLTRAATKQELEKLKVFFISMHEGIAVASADSSRVVPQAIYPHEKNARGALRKSFTERALIHASEISGFEIKHTWTKPATWRYSTVCIGAFTISVCVVGRRYSGSKQQIRTKSKFIRDICRMNSPFNPQGSFFDFESDSVTALTPDGVFGGLIVSEHEAHRPEVPAYVGFWVPSEDLKSAYFRFSFEQVISFLDDRLATFGRPKRKPITRKAPQMRKKKSSDDRK